MKTIRHNLLALSLLAMLLVASGCNETGEAGAGTETASTLVSAELAVSGMTCSNCENAITATLGSLDGVDTVKAEHSASIVSVSYNPAVTNEEEISAAISKLGFKVGEKAAEVGDTDESDEAGDAGDAGEEATASS